MALVDISEDLWIAIVAATVPALLSACGYALVQTVRYIRATIRTEALYEQALRTIAAKDEEMATVKQDRDRLWSLLDELTQ